VNILALFWLNENNDKAKVIIINGMFTDVTIIFTTTIPPSNVDTISDMWECAAEYGKRRKTPARPILIDYNIYYIM